MHSIMKSVESEVERVKRRIAVKDQKLHTVLDALESELDSPHYRARNKRRRNRQDGEEY
jgi:hypothetical protein